MTDIDSDAKRRFNAKIWWRARLSFYAEARPGLIWASGMLAELARAGGLTPITLAMKNDYYDRAEAELALENEGGWSTIDRSPQKAQDGRSAPAPASPPEATP